MKVRMCVCNACVVGKVCVMGTCECVYVSACVGVCGVCVYSSERAWCW